jgi:hypothetical protein
MDNHGLIKQQSSCEVACHLAEWLFRLRAVDAFQSDSNSPPIRDFNGVTINHVDNPGREVSPELRGCEVTAVDVEQRARQGCCEIPQAAGSQCQELPFRASSTGSSK